MLKSTQYTSIRGYVQLGDLRTNPQFIYCCTYNINGGMTRPVSTLSQFPSVTTVQTTIFYANGHKFKAYHDRLMPTGDGQSIILAIFLLGLDGRTPVDLPLDAIGLGGFVRFEHFNAIFTKWKF